MNSLSCGLPPACAASGHVRVFPSQSETVSSDRAHLRHISCHSPSPDKSKTVFCCREPHYGAGYHQLHRPDLFPPRCNTVTEITTQKVPGRVWPISMYLHTDFGTWQRRPDRLRTARTQMHNYNSPLGFCRFSSVFGPLRLRHRTSSCGSAFQLTCSRQASSESGFLLCGHADPNNVVSPVAMNRTVRLR